MTAGWSWMATPLGDGGAGRTGDAHLAPTPVIWTGYYVRAACRTMVVAHPAPPHVQRCPSCLEVATGRVMAGGSDS